MPSCPFFICIVIAKPPNFNYHLIIFIYSWVPPLLLESLFYINQTMGNYLSKADLSKFPLKLDEAVPLSHKITQN